LIVPESLENVLAAESCENSEIVNEKDVGSMQFLQIPDLGS